ncbi:hypothetical protein BCR39DRAFT_503679 [Naematelia encephala]|uniref:Uncharacterized protein n=1 Tax=Naematelia encephala TaxID=71784 RepID=A0A1Y2BGU5_9TREE|nr:hypothetical protein BCR39DRAFT_503679 [Naematelia encephala]
MKSVFAYLNIFISTLVVSVYGKYADKVSASEVSLATRLDDFVSNNPNTYQFIALASNGSVVAQSLWVNDTIAFEAFFTNTETLDAYIKSNQIAGYQAAVTSGYDTPSLEEIQAYRYDVDDLLKRTNTPSHPDSEPRDNGRLADCGQPCSAGSDCPGRCPDCELLDGERVCIRANKDSSYNVNDLSKRTAQSIAPAMMIAEEETALIAGTLVLREDMSVILFTRGKSLDPFPSPGAMDVSKADRGVVMLLANPIATVARPVYIATVTLFMKSTVRIEQ